MAVKIPCIHHALNERTGEWVERPGYIRDPDPLPQAVRFKKISDAIMALCEGFDVMKWNVAHADIADGIDTSMIWFGVQRLMPRKLRVAANAVLATEVMPDYSVGKPVVRAAGDPSQIFLYTECNDPLMRSRIKKRGKHYVTFLEHRDYSRNLTMAFQFNGEDPSDTAMVRYGIYRSQHSAHWPAEMTRSIFAPNMAETGYEGHGRMSAELTPEQEDTFLDICTTVAGLSAVLD